MPLAEHPLANAVRKEKRLPVWLTHLWQRLSDHNRLGLVLGAGVSYDAKIPMWEELVNRLAVAANISEDRLKLHKKERFPETFLAEILFRNHSADSERKARKNKHHVHYVNSSWKRKIRECLYKDLGATNFDEIAQGHPYLKSLASLVCKADFTVTFNFDDIVDQAVVARVEEILRASPDARISNPEIIYHPKVETRKHAPVIYHINGSLPRDEIRRGSEKVVLTEDAFADVLLSPNSHDANYVINQFAMRTFLLLGVSLSDSSLKNILRSSAKRNPANHHFIIFHEKDGERRSDEVRADIFNANLNVYNLISIFLTTAEIKAFIEIMNSANGSEFDDALRALVSSKIDRKYYLVGSVAAGKSSTIDVLRCFTTHEEFAGRVPAAMYQDDTTITPEDQKIIDDYLFPQLLNKNANMIRMNSGIRIMDRAFLDLFAFSKSDESQILRKALELKRRLKDWGKPMESGHVFFLRASKNVLEERMARRGAQRLETGAFRYKIETLQKQEAELLKTYGLTREVAVDTTSSSPGETARDIARTILLDEYREIDFSARLDEIIRDKGKL